MKELKITGRLENLSQDDVWLYHAANGMRGCFPAAARLYDGQWYTGKEAQGEVFGSLNEVFDLVIPSQELVEAAQAVLERQKKQPLQLGWPIASRKLVVKTYYLVDLELAVWNHLERGAQDDMLLPVGVVEDDDGQILGFRGLVPTETLFAWSDTRGRLAR